MIGLLFIYWIWKGFTNLAINYGKNKWKYFFIGFGSYYVASILFGIFFAIWSLIINNFDWRVAVESLDNEALAFMYVLFGGIGCYATYKLLEKRAKKEKELMEKEGLESIGVKDEN
jgi:hypothetical protein